MDSSPRHLQLVDAVDDDYARSQLDLFADLIEVVGDAETLWRLDTDPLPDEAFDWSTVDPADKAFVEEVLALSDECARLALGPEFRTVTRRILARVAARDPHPFRRSPHAPRCAASLVWLAGQINGGFFFRGRRSASWVWKWFGVANCGERGRSLGRAAGFDPWYASPSQGWAVGEPTLLTSRYRSALIRERERLLDIAEHRRTWRITEADECVERIEVRVESASFVSAAKGLLTGTERAAVIVGFGDRVEDAHYMALSIPDAHELVHRVQLALDAPIPTF